MLYFLPENEKSAGGQETCGIPEAENHSGGHSNCASSWFPNNVAQGIPLFLVGEMA